MANIQMIYSEGCCKRGSREYCEQCHSDYASELDCPYYKAHKTDCNDDNVIFWGGECIHADYEERYKGTTVKRYSIEPYRGYDYSDKVTSMLVTISGVEYYCDKVVLDGECIYDNRDDND